MTAKKKSKKISRSYFPKRIVETMNLSQRSCKHITTPINSLPTHSSIHKVLVRVPDYINEQCKRLCLIGPERNEPLLFDM